MNGIGASQSIATLLAAAAALVASAQDSPLDKPLVATRHLIYAPAGDLRAPTDAAALGYFSRLARIAAVPFGFEADSISPRPASSAPVEPHEVAATTLREGLDAFIRLDPRYEWRDLGGIYVVRSRTAWSDPSNVLNRRVAAVEWRDLDVVSVFNRLARLLYPSAPSPVYPGFRGETSRPINVRAPGGSLLDLLDVIALADGQLGWCVTYGRTSDRIQFWLTLGHYGIGPRHGWSKRPEGSVP